MRRTIASTILAALALAALAAATSLAAAKVTTQTASAGGLTATLTYSDGPGITTKDERLAITQTAARSTTSSAGDGLFQGLQSRAVSARSTSRSCTATTARTSC